MSMVRHALSAIVLTVVVPASSRALEPCDREDLPAGSRCGAISVPASYDDPEAGSIELDVVVLPARDGNGAAADPIVFLAGGPGVAATRSARYFARNLTKMQQSRDLVLVDIRGTGRSAPDCRLTAAEKRDLVYAFRAPASFAPCAPDPRIRESHRTTVFARDLDHVRRALGAGQINLLAASYGTRLALEYARLFPERVRACVLRGATSTGDVIPLQILEGARAELDGLERAHPGFTMKYTKLVEALDAKPVTVVFDTNEVVVDGATFEGVARLLLYDPGTARALPDLVEATSSGVLEPLTRVVAGAEPVVAAFSIPVLLGVLCAEDVPFWRRPRADGPFAPAAVHGNALATCRAWSVPAAPRSFRKPVRAQVPTLLLSGTNDPAAPDQVAARIADVLPNALHLVTPGIGHFPTWTSCHAAIIAEFFETAKVDGLDIACAAESPGR